jgi:5'-nucleotidase
MEIRMVPHFWKRMLSGAAALFCCSAAVWAQNAVDVKILAINDLHGQITTGPKVSNRPVGGAAVLASYLESAQRGWEKRCILVEAGDLIGASQAECALLQDEPAIMLMNYLNGTMQVVGALGNHELDRGIPELMRLIKGGNHDDGPFLQDPWQGATFPMINANMIDTGTGFPVFNPFWILTIPEIDVPIAFIGIAPKETPSMVPASSIRGLKFVDEIKTVNHYVSMLRDVLGIHAFVVLFHQGGSQMPYAGWTDTLKPGPSADIVALASQLDEDVDVVCTAHTHNFTNAIIRRKNGRTLLLTQAYSKGVTYAEIVCTVDKSTRGITAKKAQIVSVWGDEGPGLSPDPVMAALVDTCKRRVAHQTERVIGLAKTAIARQQTSAGESALGDLIADAQRAAMRTDFAMMNPGGIRSDLGAGPITWGALHATQPFRDYLVKMNLTGQQIYMALNQQWAGQPHAKMLETSGLAYTWANHLPIGNRVVQIRKNGVPIDRSATYSITVNSFLAGGGDNFTAFLNGTDLIKGPNDLDALVSYVKSFMQPINRSVEGRAVQLH